jgi:hypothetical protein
MITHTGYNNRDHIQAFQNNLIARFASSKTAVEPALSTDVLGRNFSGFVLEKDEKKLLVLLDVDDGSGGTPSDCKIVWSSLHSVLQKHKPHDMVVLKSQVNRDPECNQFYPFKNDVFPIGIFSNNPERVFKRLEQHPQREQDIDVFYAGGYKHVKNRPYVWPKNRDIRRWWSGASVRGYERLLELKEKRKDIKFALFDDSIPPDSFYDMLRRSKVCIDLPGVGLSSRKFYECMVFGKCVVSLRQQFTPWECEENEHYVSLGDDYDFDTLEAKIDDALGDDFRRKVERNVSSISHQLTLDYMIDRVVAYLANKIDSMNEEFVLQY